MQLVMLCAGEGSRIKERTSGKPKQFLTVGGKSIYERQLDLASFLDLEPVVITLEEFAPHFERPSVEVVSIPGTGDIIHTLYEARRYVSEDFCWIGGDMIFTDHGQLASLVEAHHEREAVASFFYTTKECLKARLVPTDPPEVIVSKKSSSTLSIPSFLVHSPEIFDHMNREPMLDFLQYAIDAGEKVYFEEYRSPLFEIDTPQDIDRANRHFQNGD